MDFLTHPHRTYIIAEAGVNHDGKKEQALALIDAAAEAGADAVKFQLFDAEELAVSAAPLAAYQKRSGEENQQDMLRRLMLPPEDYRTLKAYADEKGIDFMVTPFDINAARFLADLGVEAIKIGSGELTNLPFLRDVAGLRIFTILSTGMATMEEVAEAVEPFTEAKTPYALLHCVSAYPAPAHQINLRAMQTLRKTFAVPVGFSDHTPGIDVAVAAVAAGADIIEKHITLDSSLRGPDHAMSLEPPAFQKMVLYIRSTEAVLGSSEKKCQPCEEQTRDVVRRSLVFAKDVPAGTVIIKDMLTLKRPGTGMPPSALSRVIGKRLTVDAIAGTLLLPDMIV